MASNNVPLSSRPRAKIPLLYVLPPSLEWLPELKDRQVLQADIIAGGTVALVLIPRSMAYANLAGLPAYFDLYIAFMPVLVAALWGSSRQLATGPAARGEDTALTPKMRDWEWE